MAATPVTLEVRYRATESTITWRVERFPADAATVSLAGSFIRGWSYEVEARYIGDNGMPSAWVPATVVIADAPTGAAAYPPGIVGNVGSRWVSGTSVTYSATDTSATISVSAGVLQVADLQVSYGSSAATVSGTADSTVTYYLYYDDPFFAGGSRTLGVTTDAVASMSESGRVFITSIPVKFATTGGSSSGGGDIGGNGGGSGGRPPLFETEPL